MWLETDRLLLRPVEYMDIDQLVAMWADPDVTRCMGGPRDRDRVRDMLDEEASDPPKGPFGQWPLIEKAGGRVAGDCGLVEKDVDGVTEVELVYVLARHAWGKGYATEIGSALLRFAFGVLDLPRVVSLIDAENAASKRVAAKLGMQLERVVLRPDGAERELWVAERPAER
jgi:RimJ/RimL family protein N-acetyltransferase